MGFATSYAQAHGPADGSPPRAGDEHPVAAEPEPAPPEAEAPPTEVTVRARRARPLTASTTRVSAREMAAVPRRNAEDALRLVPGFTLVQHGSEGKGHQFFLRGFDAIHGSDLELTVEGIPVNEWSNVHAQGYLDLGFVIPEVIDAVEVVKGPFTLDQGLFAMAGSAAYRLGVPEPDRGLRTAYTIGSTNRHRGVATFSPRSGDGREFVATEALHDEGFGARRSIDRGAVMGRVRLGGTPREGETSWLASAYTARFELPGAVRADDVEAGRVAADGAYDAGQFGSSSRGLTALVYALEDEVHALDATAYASHRRLTLRENTTGYLGDPERGDRRLQRQITWSVGGVARHEARMHRAVAITSGVGLQIDALDQAQHRLEEGGRSVGVDRSLAGGQLAAHAYTGLSLRPFDGVRIEGGSRLDLAHVTVQDRLTGGPTGGDTLIAHSPRVSLEVRALPSLRVFGAFGRGVRPPEARAFAASTPTITGLGDEPYAGGPPALTRATSTEIGARWSPHVVFGAKVAGFGTFIERESVFDHVSGTSLELGGTRRLGAELELHSHPTEWLFLTADTTVVDARFEQSQNPIPLAPWLVGGARAVLTHPSGLRAGLRFFAYAPRDLPHAATGAALAEFDATVGYHAPRFRLDLDLENALDALVREGEYHYASHWRRGEPASQLPVSHFVAGAPRNLRATVTVLY